MHCYVCPDMAKGALALVQKNFGGILSRLCVGIAEFLKYDDNPEKYIRTYQGTKASTQSCCAGTFASPRLPVAPRAEDYRPKLELRRWL